MRLGNLNLPSGERPTRKMVTAGAALQPNSMVGPMCLLQWTPTRAPVSVLAREQAAVPQCQKVMVFSFSSRDTGSPKNAGLPVSSCPIYMESAP